ncbi:MAG: CCA tRNA nucleotidyltransferase [Hadesarchaea archaeon]|nr:CCA tRNA nucleotidyltransferase [Hadesarchaea archaeon]
MRELLDEVLKEIKPQKEDQEKLNQASEELLENARELIEEKNYDAEPLIVGSSARGTWLKGEKDIDIFLLFPKESTKTELEEKGLEIARELAEGKGVEQFAEHPYIKTSIGEFDVDIVPCYDIEHPGKLRSSVDRSPHHQDYVKSQLTPELADEVLLLKQFLKGIGVYGAELKVHGFSGYLAELLIIRFESFQNLIQEASKWKEGKIIDFSQDYSSPEDVYRMFPDQSLIVTDPVDPSRNVAAAVSRKNYATFVRACESFNRNPGENFFFPESPKLPKNEIKELIKKRGTKLFSIIIDTPPNSVSDVIYPQLRKTKNTLVQRLKANDFRVLRNEVYSNQEKSIIIIELTVSELPKAYKHEGPPLGVKSSSFIQKHIDSSQKLAGPFIDETGDLAFELKRSKPRAELVIRDSLERCEGFGKDIAEEIKEDYEILEGESILEVVDADDLQEFLANYLTNCLPWYR